MQIFMLHNMLVRIFFTFCLFLFRIDFYPIKRNRFENRREAQKYIYPHSNVDICSEAALHMFHVADYLYLRQQNKQENITQYRKINILTYLNM